MAALEASRGRRGPDDFSPWKGQVEMGISMLTLLVTFEMAMVVNSPKLHQSPSDTRLVTLNAVKRQPLATGLGPSKTITRATVALSSAPSAQNFPSQTTFRPRLVISTPSQPCSLASHCQSSRCSRHPPPTRTSSTTLVSALE